MIFIFIYKIFIFAIFNLAIIFIYNNSYWIMNKISLFLSIQNCFISFYQIFLKFNNLRYSEMLNIEKDSKIIKVRLIPSQSKPNHIISQIYEFFEKESIDVSILEPKNTVCVSKLSPNIFYVVNCNICGDISNAFSLKSDNLNFKDSLQSAFKKFKEDFSLICSDLQMKNESSLTSISLFNKNCNNQKNNKFIDENNIKNYENIKRDFTSFMFSRFSQIEKAKKGKIWNIIFTSYYFQETANLMERYILAMNPPCCSSQQILVYKSFLVDASFERLIALDNVDVVVLIDCPLLFPFFNEHLIPILTPFDVLIMFEEWKEPVYLPNQVYMRKHVCEQSSEKMCVYKNNSLILNDIKSQQNLLQVPFSSDNYNEKILPGSVGIASEYKELTYKK